MAEGLLNELREVEPADGGVPLPSKDVRQRRPTGLALILRLETARRLARMGALVLLDFVAIYAAIWTALEFKAVVRGQSDVALSFDQAQEFAPLAFLVTFLLFANADLYADRAVRPGFSKIVGALFQVALVSLIYGVVVGGEFSSYYIFYGSLFFSLLYVSLVRVGFDRITGAVLRAAGYHRRAMLVGSGAQIEATAHALKGSGVEPVGYSSLTPLGDEHGMRDFGPVSDIANHFGEIDEVLIADPAFPQEQAVVLVDTCHDHGVRVRVAPSTMEILMDRVEFVPGQTLPLFELKPPVFDGVDFITKRVFDIAGSVFLILVLSPVLLTAAALVRFTSRGSVAFRSMRPGIGGEPFACFKFRTMYEGSERDQHELEAMNEAGGAIFKIKDDPRVTPVGRFLRRWSIDELPQLFNVLRGEMSLVGPRPLTQRDFDKLEEWHRKRYLVLPGMTGLWQVSGRSELDFDELVRLDFLYLERWSVFLDLSILMKTIPAVISSKGAW
ncbi:MAG: sugar transferase [Thermoleophilaceae bacterium]|nr:sugar transferase [Thermoleophilaceae bacterium]